MKTYCKPKTVNIESVEFNSPAVHLGFAGKLGKKEFQDLLLATGKITRAELHDEIRKNSCVKILGAIDVVAEELTQRIRDRDLQLKPVFSFQRRDGISQKLRDLNKETAVPIQVVAVPMRVYPRQGPDWRQKAAGENTPQKISL